MPIRKELEVLTADLKKGDVVKKWPGGRTNLLGAELLKKEYGDVWIRLVFDDEHQLPPTKRFRATEYWTVWRTELTEVEKAEQTLEHQEKRLFQAAESARLDWMRVVERIGKRGANTDHVAEDALDLLNEGALYDIWLSILGLWERHNKQRHTPFYRPDNDDINPEFDWGIGEAAWSWCVNVRREIASGNLSIRQNWSNSVHNEWRSRQEEARYKQTCKEYSSIWGLVKPWKIAFDILQAAKKEETNASEGSAASGDSKSDSTGDQPSF